MLHLPYTAMLQRPKNNAINFYNSKPGALESNGSNIASYHAVVIIIYYIVILYEELTLAGHSIQQLSNKYQIL